MAERIRDAQKELGRTLRRARLVEDRALAKTVRELGERLAHINHGLMQLMRLHDVSNEAFDRPVEEFRCVLGQLIEMLGPVNLVCVEDQVYVNDIRVRFDTQQQHAEALERMLRRHNMGGLTYFQALSGEQVRAAFKLFAAEAAPERPRTSLQKQLAEIGLSSIELQPIFQFRGEDESVDKSLSEVYGATIEVVAETFSNMAASRLPNPLPVRRIIHDLLDVTEARDLCQIAFEVEASTPHFARHTLMVTNLAILLGRAAGLPDASLANLGVSAMLHDVGFCGAESGRRPSFEEHTRAGLKVLLRQRGFHEARIQRLLVVLEHHDPYARAGGAPSLHARIIHIVDDYDSMTRHRSKRGPIYVPPDAIRLMAAHGGGAYDPALLQLFINALGVYPPGSLLKLSDGTMVLSSTGVRSPETFATPICRVVRLPDGSEPAERMWADLAKGGRVVEVVGTRLTPSAPEPVAATPPAEPAEPGPEPPVTKPVSAVTKPAPPPAIPPPSAAAGGMILPGLRMPKPAKKDE